MVIEWPIGVLYSFFSFKLQKKYMYMYILKSSISLSAASELKVWLLYYSLPALIGVLPKKYLQHFALFVEAMYILLGDNISREDLRLQKTSWMAFTRLLNNL